MDAIKNKSIGKKDVKKDYENLPLTTFLSLYPAKKIKNRKLRVLYAKAQKSVGELTKHLKKVKKSPAAGVPYTPTETTQQQTQQISDL